MGRQQSLKPTGKYVVRKNQINSAGMAPVYITYFIKGKTIEKSTDIKVLVNQWDAKNQKIVKHNDAKLLNNKLASIKRGYDEAIEGYDGVITPDILRKLLNGEEIGGRPNPKKADFIQYARDINQRRYDNNKIGYSVFYNAKLSIERFAKYIQSVRGEASIPIAEMTIDIIEDFKDRRREEKKLCHATINKDIVPIVKAIENAEKNGLIDPSVFGDLNELYVSEAHGEKGEKDIRYLTKEQMNSFIEYYSKTKNYRTKEFMEIFLFSFHSCGLRVSDVATLEWNHIDFENKRLTKQLIKTDYRYDIRLNQYALDILNKWKKKNRNPTYVFNLLPTDFRYKRGELEDERRLKMKINSKNKIIQTSLNGIGKKIGLDFNLSMHVARHTFAVWALNYGKVSLHLVSQMLGHSSIVATEKSYAKFVKETIDDAIINKATFDGCLPEL